MSKKPAKALHAKLRRDAHKDGTYERIYEKQGGLCAICKREETRRRLDIDHCHGSMEIRGLLCRGCNMRLRRDHKPEWLRAAADYLEKGE